MKLKAYLDKRGIRQTVALEEINQLIGEEKKIRKGDFSRYVSDQRTPSLERIVLIHDWSDGEVGTADWSDEASVLDRIIITERKPEPGD